MSVDDSSAHAAVGGLEQYWNNIGCQVSGCPHEMKCLSRPQAQLNATGSGLVRCDERRPMIRPSGISRLATFASVLYNYRSVSLASGASYGLVSCS